MGGSGIAYEVPPLQHAQETGFVRKRGVTMEGDAVQEKTLSFNSPGEWQYICTLGGQRRRRA